MNNVPDTAIGRMYREHIELIKAKKVDELLERQYAPNAILISSFTKTPKIFRGLAELKQHMQGILEIQDLETDVVFYAETENPQTLMVTEKISMRAPDGGRANMRFADSWVIENGKIVIHFAGMVQHADGTLA